MYMEKSTLRLLLVWMFIFIFFLFFCILPWIVNGVATAVWESCLCRRCGLFFEAFLRGPWGALVGSGIMRQAPTRKNHVRGNFSKVARTLPPHDFCLVKSLHPLLSFRTRRRDFAQVLCGTAGGGRELGGADGWSRRPLAAFNLPSHTLPREME